MAKVNEKGLRLDRYIPQEVEEGEYFVGGTGPNVIEPDENDYGCDPIKEHKLKLRKRDEWCHTVQEFEEDEGILAKHPVPAVLFTFNEIIDPFWEVDCICRLIEARREYAKKGLYEVPWNFIVGGDGTVFEARGWDRMPEPFADAPEWANNSFEIAHFGVRGVLPPNKEQIAASWELVLEGIKKRYIAPLPKRLSFFYK